MYIHTEIIFKNVDIRLGVNIRCRTIYSQSIRNMSKILKKEIVKNRRIRVIVVTVLENYILQWAKFASHAIKSFLLAILTFVHSRHMTYTAIVGLSEFTLQEFSINSNRGNEWESRVKGELRDSIFALARALQQFVYDVVNVVSSKWLSGFRLLLPLSEQPAISQ